MSFKEFLADNRAFANIIYGAVGLVIFVIMIASVVMPQIIGTATNGANNAVCYNAGPPISYNASCPWNAATIALWGVLPLVIIASAVMFVIGKR